MPTDLKQIVFIRHAHRDTAQREDDNGLSSKGLEQVDKLKKKYRENKLPKGLIFLTSPKKRCVETLGPVAELANGKLKTVESLDEQSSNENISDLQLRIENFISDISLLIPASHALYICSHGDVIPLAIEILTGKVIDIEKGRAVILTLDGVRWSLE
jgi:broad specificity phosphatase PhoE